MPQVRMLNPEDGTRADGTPWPERGGVIDVSDDEAADLVASGRASLVSDEDGPLPPAPDHGKRDDDEADAAAAELRREADLRAAEAAEARIAAGEGRDAEDQLVRDTAEAAKEADAEAGDAEKKAAHGHDHRADPRAGGRQDPSARRTDGHQRPRS